MNKDNLLSPLLIALALLTRLPVTRWLPNHWNKQQQGLSTLWYPMVGVILSIILYFFLTLLPIESSPLISAALIVCIWVGLTGALHLDGLADSVDAAFAAHRIAGNPEASEKILSVFKDPAAGPMAVIAIVLILLLKIVLLSELLLNLGDQLLLALILTLSLPRTLAVSFIISTPYVRHNGIGQVLAQYTPTLSAFWVILAVAFVSFLLMPFFMWLMLMILLSSFFWYWRNFWLSKINGIVGDCIGALIEFCEVIVLLVIYFASI